MDLAETFIQHLASEFGEPVIQACKDPKGATAEEYIVNVSNDKVAIRHLVVKRHHSQRHTVETTDQEHSNETDREEHRRLKADFAAHHRRDPVKDLHRCRNSNQCRTGCEEGLSDRRQANCKHVVCPHCEAEEADSHTGPGNKGITKDW